MQINSGGEELDLSTMPALEDQAKIPGNHNGEIKVFWYQGGGKAYMWKTEENWWELIGDVQMPKS